jgi:hypothetical protein
MAGAGTQTAGLGVGGYTTAQVNNTEEYDGTSWTAGGNLNTARSGLAGAGIQTAGLAFGGTNATEEYNGTSWTVSGNLATARYFLAGAGTQTSALGFGGYTTTFSAATEEYTDPTFAVKTITTSTT